MKIKLAEALGRRKELQNKVDQLKAINAEKLYKIEVNRQKVTDDVDDIVARVPKVSFTQITHDYDWHAKQLRLIDAVIQQANWSTEIDVKPETMGDYVDPYVKESK